VDENVSKCVRKLESTLRLQSHRLGEFLDDLVNYLDRSLEQCLQPIRTRGHNSSSSSSSSSAIVAARGPQSFGIGAGDSFLKLLLRLQPIQSKLIEVLVEKIIHFSSLEDTWPLSQVVRVGGAVPPTAVAMALLNHIRWCEVLFYPKVPHDSVALFVVPLFVYTSPWSQALTDKLLEAVPILPRAMQIEVISTLPAFANDRDHAALVTALLPMAHEPPLVACVLDTISNLCLPAQCKEMRAVLRTATDLLGSAEPAQLPIIVHFLLGAADVASADQVLAALREHLTAFLLQAPKPVPAGHPDAAAREARNVHLNAQALVVMHLKTAFVARPLLGAALLKVT
jgi:hypothetical protein